MRSALNTYLIYLFYHMKPLFFESTASGPFADLLKLHMAGRCRGSTLNTRPANAAQQRRSQPAREAAAGKPPYRWLRQPPQARKLT